jgi:hypothetical protein
VNEHLCKKKKHRKQVKHIKAHFWEVWIEAIGGSSATLPADEGLLLATY